MTTYFPSFDDALGDSADRYFGHGYKHVGHELVDLVLQPGTGAGSTHSATAVLTYPLQWSTKGSRELVPHVSSVDTLALAATLLETAITRTRHITCAEAGRLWVSHARVTAGGKPEEDLHNIATRVEVTAVTEGSAEAATTAKFRVGQLRGEMTIIHPVGAGSAQTGGHDHSGELSTAPSLSPQPFYLQGFKTHTLVGTDIAVDADAQSIRCNVAVQMDSSVPISGAESAWPQSVSIIDAVLGAAQLSQILLYEMDGVARADSNTLWMRKLELFAQRPPRDATRPFTGAVSMRRASSIDRGGQTWRSADLQVTDFGGITGSCLLAHQLPAAIAS